MQEELITFETAVLAKKTGFDWKVRDAFVNTNIHEGDNTKDNSLPNEYLELQNHNEKQHRISRPSQSLLQRWLLEAHEIHITVNREVIGSDEWDFSYKIDYLEKMYWVTKRRCQHFKEIESFSMSSSSYTGAWRTYEEAMEQALLKGLSLIP